MRVALTQSGAAMPYLAWADRDAIRLAPLDSGDAREAGPAVSIATPRRAAWVAAVNVASGIFALWAYDDEAQLVAARVEGDVALAKVEHDLAGGGATEPVWEDARVMALQDDLLLAVPMQIERGSRVVRLVRLDARTGQERQWGPGRVVAYWVQPTVLEDRVLLLYPDDAGGVLQELAADGSARGQLHLPQPIEEARVLALQDAPNQVLLVARDGAALQLHRVALAPEPHVVISTPLQMPGEPGTLNGMSMLQVGGRVFLALPAVGVFGAEEIYLMGFDPADLSTTTRWRRISAEDLTHSTQPLLAAGTDGGLLVVWRDLHLQDMQIRSRCVRP
jgi:hypothetical protein